MQAALPDHLIKCVRHSVSKKNQLNHANMQNWRSSELWFQEVSRFCFSLARHEFCHLDIRKPTRSNLFQHWSTDEAPSLEANRKSNLQRTTALITAKLIFKEQLIVERRYPKVNYSEHTDILFSSRDTFKRRSWHVVARGEHSKQPCTPNHPKCDVFHGRVERVGLLYEHLARGSAINARDKE